MSVLAQRLSAPDKPDAGSNASTIMGAVGLLSIAALYGWIGLSSVGSTGSISIGIAIWISSNDSHQKRVEQVQREAPRWQKAMVRWNQLYYCSRDDSVFIPSQEAASISSMKEYIYRS